MELRLVGTFKTASNYYYPDAAFFVDRSMSKEIQEKVLNHLRQGEKFLMSRFLTRNENSYCRFRCDSYSGDDWYYTDGFYVWQDDYAHHIACHDVSVPLEFLNHIYTGKRIKLFSSNEQINYLEDLENVYIDENWWYNQKGLLSKTYTHPLNSNYRLFLYDPIDAKTRIKSLYHTLEVKEVVHCAETDFYYSEVDVAIAPYDSCSFSDILAIMEKEGVSFEWKEM